MFLKNLMRSRVVLAIIAVQILVFLAQLVDPAVAERLSLPGDADVWTDRPWSPFTVMFVHEDFVHLAVMVVMLAAFGMVLEHSAPARHLIAVYLLAGVAGSLGVVASLAAFPSLADDGTFVGASAAVFGVTAAVVAMRPRARIYRGQATQWLAVLVAVNVVFAFAQPLSSVAHLVGLAVGVMYGRRLRTGFHLHAEARI